MNFFERAIDLISSLNRSRKIGLLLVVILSGAVFLTVVNLQKQQQLRQNAEENAPVTCRNLRGNYTCPAGSSCPDPTSTDALGEDCILPISTPIPSLIPTSIPIFTPVPPTSTPIPFEPTSTPTPIPSNCKYVPSGQGEPFSLDCPTPTPSPTSTPTTPKISCGPTLTCDSINQQCGNLTDPTSGKITYYCAPKYTIPTPTFTPTPTNTPTPTPLAPKTSTTPAFCSFKNKGDADCDNKITILDFNIWKTEFEKELSGTSSQKKSDFNQNNVIDIIDFNMWKTGFADLFLQR